MVSALDALARLRAGNDRFVRGESLRDPLMSHARRAELAEQGQAPFATGVVEFFTD